MKKKENPYFSIIIPTLNEEKYLPRLLEGLKKQKDKDFEIIIVDGNSTDKTKEVVDHFNQYLPIKFFQVKKRNVSYQRNFGGRRAKGKYLIFLDADCEIFPSFIVKLKKSIDKEKGLFFIPFSLPERGYKEFGPIFSLINLIIDVSQNVNRPFSAGGNMIIEKHLFNLLGGFNEKLFISEDHHLVFYASKWGVRSKFLPQVKIRVSLRRLKKEGGVKLFYKYLLATIQYLFGKKIKKKIFDYKMGGEIYQEDGDKKKKKLINQYFKQAKEIFKKLTS